MADNFSASHTVNLVEHLDDPVALTKTLIDIESVSGNERTIADAVQAALEHISAHGTPLRILRDGDTLVAQTNLGKAERVLVAGHLDTVPVENNLPAWYAKTDPEGHSGEFLFGRGACDMKAGVAMALVAAAHLRAPARDVTWIFYDHEEVDSNLNGLGRVARHHPEWLTGDFAILGEPSNAGIEGGCNGTMRVDVTTRGVRAHSARAFMGKNAIHATADVLTRLAQFEAPTVHVDGLDYRESLSAVDIRGGVAGNVVPDECTVSVNYRFAPSKSGQGAEAFLREFFHGYEVVLTDVAPGARPGLDRPAAAAFIQAVGATPAPKLGWTDVSRFSELGIPAVNFGPGNPLYAHKADEHVPVAEIIQSCNQLIAFLEPGSD